MKTKSLGRYIVADPDTCHGEPTFRGTRILVADVLEQVANGMDWEAIIEEWRGKLTKEAIAEAVRLAREALITHTPELITETTKRGTIDEGRVTRDERAISVPRLSLKFVRFVFHKNFPKKEVFTE